jgi:hypothetical protein
MEGSFLQADIKVMTLNNARIKTDFFMLYKI